MARGIQLDYQRTARRTPWLGAMLLMVATAPLAVMLGQLQELEDEAQVWQTKAKTYERTLSRRAAANSTASPSKELMREIELANDVVRQLTVPWGQLFESMESCNCKDVALLAVDPDGKKATVKISAEARTLGAMLDYVRHLEQQPAFTEVFLQSHQVQQQDPDRPVRFLLLATWSRMP